MSKNIENIDRYLKGVQLPEYESNQHWQRLRREVLEKIERRQIMFVRKRTWKVAMVLAILIGVGAVSVVAVSVGRYYYYIGRNDDGAPIFRSEDFTVTATLDDDEVTDVEQARRYLEEMKILSEQGKKELLKVEETMTDGTLEMRVHVYRYELSDGRTIDQREGGPEGAYALSGKGLWEEWCQLKKAGHGEDLGTYEETVEGRVFSFKREKYFLSDGTEVIWSVGLPKDGQ